MIGGVSHAGLTVPRVRDVAIWDSMPTDLMEPSKGRVRSPAAFYRFRGNDSKQLLDYSGNSYHLSMVS
ncbi:hypothetical protein Poly41_31170 [Novipirellula artificiosorum]|uniref:Uncharacterized protein n=1 Tax=Novipirellula artificiosorum TaxID=2528016 RepID=A0A5C6DPB3_9BACT|nr:hypothetical protein Poly41_31170 [Novipirellula artificiosorum]